MTKPNLIIKNERIRAIYIIRDREFLRKYLMDTSFPAKCNFHCVNSVRNWSYSGPHFPAFGLNREKYSVSFRIQSTCGKIRTKITLNTDIFCAVFTSFLNLKQTDQWMSRFLAIFIIIYFTSTFCYVYISGNYYFLLKKPVNVKWFIWNVFQVRPISPFPMIYIFPPPILYYFYFPSRRELFET